MVENQVDRYNECIYVERIPIMPSFESKWVVIETDNKKGLRISYINNNHCINRVVTDARFDNGKLLSLSSDLGGWYS